METDKPYRSENKPYSIEFEKYPLGYAIVMKTAQNRPDLEIRYIIRDDLMTEAEIRSELSRLLKNFIDFTLKTGKF